jgi:hypothetical protein
LLRVLAATETRTTAPWATAVSPELLARVISIRGQARFLAQVELLAARPADAWRQRAAALALDDDSLALLIQWWTICDAHVAGDLIAAWASAQRSLVPLGDALGERARLGDSARIARALDEAEKAGAGPALANVRILAGLASAGRARRFRRSHAGGAPGGLRGLAHRRAKRPAPRVARNWSTS